MANGALGFETSLFSEHRPHSAQGTPAAGERSSAGRYLPVLPVAEYPVSVGRVDLHRALVDHLDAALLVRAAQRPHPAVHLWEDTAEPRRCTAPLGAPRSSALTPTGSFGPGGDGFFSAGLRGVLALLGEGTRREGRPGHRVGPNRTEMTGRGTGMDLRRLHAAGTAIASRPELRDASPDGRAPLQFKSNQSARTLAWRHHAALRRGAPPPFPAPGRKPQALLW